MDDGGRVSGFVEFSYKIVKFVCVVLAVAALLYCLDAYVCCLSSLVLFFLYGFSGS